jgi:hypothetical protein
VSRQQKHYAAVEKNKDFSAAAERRLDDAAMKDWQAIFRANELGVMSGRSQGDLNDDRDR